MRKGIAIGFDGCICTDAFSVIVSNLIGGQIMKYKDRPKIGTKMYSVHEHLYYIPGRTAPAMEYCVCEAEVQGYFVSGYTEICLAGLSPAGFMTPYFYKISEIGQKVFYTAQEAALLAQQMAEKYEQACGWMGDPPMRRPWEKYLTRTKGEKQRK